MAKKQVLVGQVFQTIGATNGRSWRVRETVTLFGPACPRGQHGG